MIILHLFFNGSGLRITDNPNLNETGPEAEYHVYFTSSSGLPIEWIQYFLNFRRNSRIFNSNTKSIDPFPKVLLKYRIWLRNFCFSCGLPSLLNAESALFVVYPGYTDMDTFWRMHTGFATMNYSLN
jgi:aromatic ring-cleaving dioxygenase